MEGERRPASRRKRVEGGPRLTPEPLATWFYLVAWIPTLVLADAILAHRQGRWFLFGRPAFTATLFAWSIPFWLAFELANLRLANWFYVNVPDGRAARWAGIALSFSTVLPAILLSERLLDAFGVARGFRARKLTVPPRLPAGLQAAGVASLALCLAFPRVFFFLIWTAPLLLADPFVRRWDPTRSLLGDLERGTPGRIARLLVGGLAIGLTWELYNAGARAGWIYTVPWFESLKLFEMPLAGFLGFPVFALTGFAAWQALVVSGLAVPREGPPRRAPGAARAAAFLLGCVFSVLVLIAMERGTIASTTPRLAELPMPADATPVPADVLTREGWDVAALAEADPAEVADVTGSTTAEAARWIGAARLVTLQGLGTSYARRLYAAGVTSVSDLAASDAHALALRLVERGVPIREARLRVWVQAAREEMPRPYPAGR